MVREIWFEKSGSRKVVREKWFYTFLEKWLQNKWLIVASLPFLPHGRKSQLIASHVLEDPVDTVRVFRPLIKMVLDQALQAVKDINSFP